MAKSHRQRVRERAGDCSEFCRLPQQYDVQPFQVDHIRARKHRGASALENLAWSCFARNSYKGTNAAGYDPVTDSLEALFDPRSQDWSDHFEWEGAYLVGRSSVGRATIETLRINLPGRVEHRRLLIEGGYVFHDGAG